MTLEETFYLFTHFKIKKGSQKSFLTLSHPSFDFNYRLDKDALTILWITTYCPCEGLGGTLIRACKHHCHEKRLLLIADQVMEDAIPFWLKMEFVPIPQTLDFEWIN